MSTVDGIAAEISRCWELLDEGRQDARSHLGGETVIDHQMLDHVRERVRDHKLFMATADRSSAAELVILMQQLGFLTSAVPYLLDEIERLRQAQPS